jgi:PKD repeat protein
VVENLHVNNPGGDCVTVTNSTNILIRRSEIGPCGGNGVVISGGSSVGIYDNYIHPEKPLSTSCCDTHDGIFGSGTSSLSIQGNVIAYGEANIELSTVSGATIIGNFLLNPIDSDPSQPADGQSRGQNFQVWGSSSNVTVTNNYTLASADTSKYLYAENQEDSINFGLTSGIVASNNSITGGHSPSGCGLIADTGANSAQFLNNTIVNSGQCGIGIADGTNQVVDSNKILNTTPVNGGGNTAIYVWKVTSSDPPCGPVQVSNNIASAITSSGGANSFWSGGGCQTVTLTNNTFDAAAASLLSSENLTPPLIPPAPKDCAVTSPFTNNTTVASCGGSVVQPSGPALTLSTTTVILNTTQGAGNPASQNVAITNGGGGTLSWSAVAASSGGWLSVTPANGTGNGELSVGGSSVNLTAGTYQGTVTVTAAGAQNSPQVLQVSLIVTAAAPPSTNEPPSCVLSVSPRNGRAPLLITATASCTSRNTIASTVINWGDGSTVTGTHGTHTYQKARSYTVKVTATDSSNLTGSASRTVKVKASHSD